MLVAGFLTFVVLVKDFKIETSYSKYLIAIYGFSIILIALVTLS